MITVWGRQNSSNVMKLLWLLDECAIPFERIDAGLSFGVNDTAEYRRMNPLGLVPVLRDGDRTLFESNSILRYLANTQAAAAALYPAEPAARAGVEAWMDAQLATFQPPLGVVFGTLVRTPPEQRNEPSVTAALTSALGRLGEALAVLETQLTERPWIASETMTLADISFGPLVHRWFALRLARPDQPALRRYYTQLLARPAYVARCAGKLS